MKMKRWNIWGSILVALLVLSGIVFATPVLRPDMGSQTMALEDPDFWLWAGQTTLAGTGNVTSDGNSMDFTIDTDCAISYIHIRIFDDEPGEGDQTGHGISPPWIHKNYTSSPQTGVFDFSIPFTPGDYTSPIYIALHADVVCGFYDGDTAWAGGSDDPQSCDRFPGDPWAYYFRYDY